MIKFGFLTRKKTKQVTILLKLTEDQMDETFKISGKSIRWSDLGKVCSAVREFIHLNDKIIKLGLNVDVKIVYMLPGVRFQSAMTFDSLIEGCIYELVKEFAK